MTEDGRWSGCSRQGFTFPGTLLGWRWMAKSLNGQRDEWWNCVWGARSRRDTAALALDSSLLRRPALMHFRHELTSLLSDRRRQHPPLFAMAGKRQLPSQLSSLLRGATSERRPAEACADEKSNLGDVDGPRQGKYRRHGITAKEREYVRNDMLPPDMSRGQHTCGSTWRGGVDTRHEVEISMERWGSSVYSLD